MRKTEILDLKKLLTVTDSINFFSPNILSENEIQHTLFEASNPRHKILMHTVDTLNAAIGQQTVKLAIHDKEMVWKMKQEKLSRRYTTKLNEVIEVRCE